MKTNTFNTSRKAINLLPDDVIYMPTNSLPLIFLFGPKGSGRTSLLVSLSSYLQEHDYLVEPDYLFRSENDKTYKDWCDNFKNICTCQHDTSLYENIHYALLQITDKESNAVCRLMELPGEYLLDPRLGNGMDFYNDKHSPIRNLLNNLFTLPCPIVWMFVIELKKFIADSDKALKIYLSWLMGHIQNDPKIYVYTKIPKHLFHTDRNSNIEILFNDADDTPLLPFAARTWETQVIWEAILHSVVSYRDIHVQQLGSTIEELKTKISL